MNGYTFVVKSTSATVKNAKHERPCPNFGVYLVENSWKELATLVKGLEPEPINQSAAKRMPYPEPNGLY
jgi:hypothetical protein